MFAQIFFFLVFNIILNFGVIDFIKKITMTNPLKFSVID